MRRFAFVKREKIEDAEVAGDPTLAGVVVERPVGVERDALPAAERLGQSRVAFPLVGPTEELHQFVAAELDFAGLEVLQRRQLDAREQHILVTSGG